MATAGAAARGAEIADIKPLESIQSQPELNKVIAALDAELFDAYNSCDLKIYGSLLADDIEFYDDQNGLSTGKDTEIGAIRDYICGKARRELVPNSFQAYHMKGYGAVEMGTHRFTHPGHDDTEPVGEAEFIILWQYKGGAWKAARIVSYDHHLARR
jgi:hypothetical protein